MYLHLLVTVDHLSEWKNSRCFGLVSCTVNFRLLSLQISRYLKVLPTDPSLIWVNSHHVWLGWEGFHLFVDQCKNQVINTWCSSDNNSIQWQHRIQCEVLAVFYRKKIKIKNSQCVLCMLKQNIKSSYIQMHVSMSYVEYIMHIITFWLHFASMPMQLKDKWVETISPSMYLNHQLSTYSTYISSRLHLVLMVYFLIWRDSGTTVSHLGNWHIYNDD